jgi:hypothetical protein
MIGIPFAVFYDPKVILKKKYLDTKARESRECKMTGNDWYQQEAS